MIAINKITFTKEQFIELKKKSVKHEIVVGPSRECANTCHSVVIPFNGKFYEVTYWSWTGHIEDEYLEGREVKKVKKTIECYE